MGEIVKQRLRQFAERTEEAVVTGAGRERTEIILKLVGVARLDEANSQRVSVAAAQRIRILLEVVAGCS
jgi:hypothetical protein